MITNGNSKNRREYDEKEKLLSALEYGDDEFSSFIEEHEVKSLLKEIIEKGCNKGLIKQLKKIVESKGIIELSSLMYDEEDDKRKSKFDRFVKAIQEIIEACKDQYDDKLAAKKAKEVLQITESILITESQADCQTENANLKTKIQTLRDAIKKIRWQGQDYKRETDISTSKTILIIFISFCAIVVTFLAIFIPYTISDHGKINIIEMEIKNIKESLKDEALKAIQTDLINQHSRTILALSEALQDNDKLKKHIVHIINQQIDDKILGKHKTFEKLSPLVFQGEIDYIDPEAESSGRLSTGKKYNPEDHVCILNRAYKWGMYENELKNFLNEIVEIVTYKKLKSGERIEFAKLYIKIGGFYSDKNHLNILASVSEAAKRILFEKKVMKVRFAKLDLKPLKREKKY